ncbi:MAG: hypothetical protein K0M45_02090 [Candidatus Paracaedibacteraceae bacterium]|nr:hypothetical protein [Candidatus Paracaedibacteraceae bacterium]
MQKRILKSIMIISLCLSYSQAAEQAGLLATIKSFFGAIPPKEADRGEGTSRILTPSSQENSLDNPANTAPDISSVPTTHDSYWKEDTIDRSSEHAPLMEEPGALMPEETQPLHPIAPFISMDEALSPAPLSDVTPEAIPPREATIPEGPLSQSQQPYMQQDDSLFPSTPKVTADNTTQIPSFSTAPYPNQRELSAPETAIDEITAVREEETPSLPPQLSTPQPFEHGDISDDRIHSQPFHD